MHLRRRWAEAVQAVAACSAASASTSTADAWSWLVGPPGRHANDGVRRVAVAKLEAYGGAVAAELARRGSDEEWMERAVTQLRRGQLEDVGPVLGDERSDRSGRRPGAGIDGEPISRVPTAHPPARPPSRRLIRR